MTVGQKWLKFKQDGYCGSLTIRSRSEQSFESDPGYNDKHIHEAILEMDPEYTYVKVIHEGYKGSMDIPTIASKLCSPTWNLYDAVFSQDQFHPRLASWDTLSTSRKLVELA